MALFGSPNHISGRDAQDDLLELVWPGLGFDTSDNMHTHRNRCHDRVANALLDVLRADEISGWTDKPADGEPIRVPRAYWDTDRASFYFYSGDIETGEETKNPDLESYYTRPWYLLRTDFEQFKFRLTNGGPGQYVSLIDAMHYVAAGSANAAAVMRWECELHRICGHDFYQEKYKKEHSAQLEAALDKLNAAWQQGILRPLGRLRQTGNGMEDYVPQALAQACEFLPLGPGEGGRIQPKDELDTNRDRSWYHVKFLRHDLEMLLPAAVVADPMSETHWTVPQCIAWIASRSSSGVTRATKDEGLRALAGAMAAAPGNFGSSRDQLLKIFRTGLTCLAIDRQTGAPGNIPVEQRAHIKFDIEHNAALIDLELRWHDLRFPVADVLNTWPPADAIEAPAAPLSHKQQTHVSPAKAKRELIDYRATLNGQVPLKQEALRKMMGAKIGYMAEKPFRELLREIDEERRPGEPALIRGRGKSGPAKPAS